MTETSETTTRKIRFTAPNLCDRDFRQYLRIMKTRTVGAEFSPGYDEDPYWTADDIWTDDIAILRSLGVIVETVEIDETGWMTVVEEN